jgi:hypothetical protein
LTEDKKIEFFRSLRPDMNFNNVKPFKAGFYSVDNGILWVTIVNVSSGYERQRAFPILELSKFKNIVSVNLEPEVTSENCL